MYIYIRKKFPADNCVGHLVKEEHVQFWSIALHGSSARMYLFKFFFKVCLVSSPFMLLTH